MGSPSKVGKNKSASGFTKKKPIAEKRIVSPKKTKTEKKDNQPKNQKTKKPRISKYKVKAPRPKIKIQVKKGRVEMFVSA